MSAAEVINNEAAIYMQNQNEQNTKKYTVINFPKSLVEPQKFTLSNFDKVEKIGEGTFGQVLKAEYIDPETGEKKLRALKKLNMINEKDGFPITALREIKYLKQLNHENIVALQDIISTKPSKKNKFRGSFYLVFEYLKHDLQGLIDKKVQFDISHLKCIMVQILKGLIYLHNQNVIHRDIKGANILISSDGTAKLADFGLARIYYPGDKKAVYTNRVVTLWYRAPELLLGARNYSDTVDTWSLGCVFAELFLQSVLFPGDKEERQVELIYDKCGSVAEDNWPGVSELKEFKILGPKKKQPRRLKEFLIKQSNGKITETFADLIDKMLAMDPKQRLTAVQALNHEFFSQSPEPSLKSQLPLLDEDYHEFVVKSEKKQKVNFKKKFVFYKPTYDPNDPNSKDFWKPEFDLYAKKSIIQAVAIPNEEHKYFSMVNNGQQNLKPFQISLTNPLEENKQGQQPVHQQQYQNPTYQGNQRQQGYQPYNKNYHHQNAPAGNHHGNYRSNPNYNKHPDFHQREQDQKNEKVNDSTSVENQLKMNDMNVTNQRRPYQRYDNYHNQHKSGTYPNQRISERNHHPQEPYGRHRGVGGDSNQNHSKGRRSRSYSRSSSSGSSKSSQSSSSSPSSSSSNSERSKNKKSRSKSSKSAVSKKDGKKMSPPQQDQKDLKSHKVSNEDENDQQQVVEKIEVQAKRENIEESHQQVPSRDHRIEHKVESHNRYEDKRHSTYRHGYYEHQDRGKMTAGKGFYVQNESSIGRTDHSRDQPKSQMRWHQDRRMQYKDYLENKHSQDNQYDHRERDRYVGERNTDRLEKKEILRQNDQVEQPHMLPANQKRELKDLDISQPLYIPTSQIMNPQVNQLKGNDEIQLESTRNAKEDSRAQNEFSNRSSAQLKDNRDSRERYGSYRERDSNINKLNQEHDYRHYQRIERSGNPQRDDNRYYNQSRMNDDRARYDTRYHTDRRNQDKSPDRYPNSRTDQEYRYQNSGKNQDQSQYNRQTDNFRDQERRRESSNAYSSNQSYRSSYQHTSTNYQHPRERGSFDDRSQAYSQPYHPQDKQRGSYNDYQTRRQYQQPSSSDSQPQQQYKHFEKRDYHNIERQRGEDRVPHWDKKPGQNMQRRSRSRSQDPKNYNQRRNDYTNRKNSNISSGRDEIGKHKEYEEGEIKKH